MWQDLTDLLQQTRDQVYKDLMFQVSYKHVFLSLKPVYKLSNQHTQGHDLLPPLSSLLQVSLHYLSTAAVAQFLHDRINLLLEDFGQLGTVLVDPRGLAVVEPGIVEHEPNIVHKLPRVNVLARVQLVLDCLKVHRRLHDVEVVL